MSYLIVYISYLIVYISPTVHIPPPDVVSVIHWCTWILGNVGKIQGFSINSWSSVQVLTTFPAVWLHLRFNYETGKHVWEETHLLLNLTSVSGRTQLWSLAFWSSCFRSTSRPFLHQPQLQTQWRQTCSGSRYFIRILKCRHHSEEASVSALTLFFCHLVLEEQHEQLS